MGNFDALERIKLSIRCSSPILYTRAMPMPEGPQRAGLGRAQLDLVGATVAARQAVPPHCLEWGGVADLGLVHVLGHVLRLQFGL